MPSDWCFVLRRGLGLLMVGCTFAWAQSPSPSIVQYSISEFIDSEEQVSGGSTVGIVYFDDNDSIQLDALHAFFRESVSDAFTLSVSSIDGRYSGKVEYRIVSPVIGWNRIPFESDKLEFIQQYPIDKLAALLTNDKTGDVYPLRWGSGEQSNHIRLYVNSERAKAFFYSQENGRRKITYCDSPSNTSRFKFNSICDVPASQVLENKGAKIHRKFGIRPVDSIVVELLIEPIEETSAGGR